MIETIAIQKLLAAVVASALIIQFGILYSWHIALSRNSSSPSETAVAM